MADMNWLRKSIYLWRLQDIADRYWRQMPTEEPFGEFLLKPPVEVIERLR